MSMSYLEILFSVSNLGVSSGGSVLTGLLADGAFKPANITAIVRTDEQNQKISKLGVNVLQIDLTDGAAITKAVSKQDGKHRSAPVPPGSIVLTLTRSKSTLSFTAPAP